MKRLLNHFILVYAALATCIAMGEHACAASAGGFFSGFDGNHIFLTLTVIAILNATSKVLGLIAAKTENKVDDNIAKILAIIARSLKEVVDFFTVKGKK